MMDALQAATDLVAIIQAKGHIAYFAGGWVRDYLMKHPSDDIDIVTDASSEVLQTYFPKTIPVGISFGIIVIVHEGHSFEVATFRTEEGYNDGRRPSKIELASPEEDAKRRDFTINGMFYDPVLEKLFDYVGGRKDLEQRVIRCIGNPHDRFNEDRLRMIRAIRYSARFHFDIEASTYKAIVDFANRLFPSVAIERVVNEFEKMARFPNFSHALCSLFKVGLLSQIFPSLAPETLKEIEKRSRCVDLFPSNAPLISKLIELFPDSSLESQMELCDYLKLSNQDKKWVAFRFDCFHKLSRPIHSIEDYDWTLLYAHPDFSVCYSIFLSKLPDDMKSNFDDSHERHQQLLLPFIQRAKENDWILSSEDLMNIGILPGPRLGQLLREGNRLAVNEKSLDKEAILSKIVKQAK